MNFLLDISRHPVLWTSVCFLLSGMLLLNYSLLQKKRWNRDLAGYQLNMLFLNLKMRPSRTISQMYSVLPLPLPALRMDQDEMQVVEGEELY